VSKGTRLAVWSGPRNISTALMRSFENRPDTVVVDEPLYAYYLSVTDAPHPGREEVIAAGVTDWRSVVAELTRERKGVVYQKQMAHHLVGEMSWDWIASLTNVLLIRQPRQVAMSYLTARQSLAASDLGLFEQERIFELLNGEVPVIDAGDFLVSPEAYLRYMCRYAGIDFLPEMLSWPPGPRPSDGIWAKHWYSRVWSSTGFETPRQDFTALSPAAEEVVEAVAPSYQRLYEARVVLG
jgi:hypothetical protein